MKFLAVLAALAAALTVVCLAAPSARAGDGFVLSMAVAGQSLDRVMTDVERAHRLGATHFNIQMGLCQKNKNSNEVEWCDSNKRLYFVDTKDAGPSFEHATKIARELKTRGFTVGLLPMLLSREDGAWRGFFEPTDFQAWSRSYLERLLEMADFGKQIGVSDFIVGTELNRLYLAPHSGAQPERNAFWREACAKVRARLAAGTSVFIVANWDQYDQIPFWDASDVIGLSAYYPLNHSESDDSSVAALVRGWADWQSKLAKLSDRIGKKLYFSELGYASESNAAHEPWGWIGKHDAELQRRLFAAFGEVWARGPLSEKLARFNVWALESPDNPSKDDGFAVIGKPAETALFEIFHRRLARDGRRADVPVLFTIDDLPMWFVGDVQERLAAYESMRATLARHHVPGIAFVNSAGLLDSEWDALRKWREGGVVLANHTAHHLPRSTNTEEAFFADVDAGEAGLRGHGASPAAFFRYPNLDFGANAEDKTRTCRKLRERGYFIVPTSFDTRDWSWAESYHGAAGATLDGRPWGGLEAQKISAAGLDALEKRFVETPALSPSPLILMMHSTRFGRDYLENILNRLELQGARWVAPAEADLSAYAADASCLPACVGAGRCF